MGGVIVDRCNACGRLELNDGEMRRLLTQKPTVDEADAGPFTRDSAGRPLTGGFALATKSRCWSSSSRSDRMNRLSSALAAAAW